MLHVRPSKVILQSWLQPICLMRGWRASQSMLYGEPPRIAPPYGPGGLLPFLGRPALCRGDLWSELIGPQPLTPLCGGRRKTPARLSPIGVSSVVKDNLN